MALGTSNRDGGKTSESGHLRAIQKLVSGEVLTGLNITQRGAGANMSVDIAPGDAIITRSDGTYGHPAWNDAVLNMAITTADASNPRRDIVIMYIDYNETPSTAVSNNTNGVVKIAVVAGTAAGSPVDPNATALQSAAGSGNPYIKLARVRVGAGVTTISNSVIDDLRSLAGPEINGGFSSLSNATLAYISASSLQVTGVDVTDKLTPGTKVRLYQGGTLKEFIVTSSSFATNTTIGLDGKGLYTLANLPIDRFQYSYTENPAGFQLSNQSDYVKDHVVSGGIWSPDNAGVNRNASMTAAVVYINGQRGTLSAVAARAFTASKDTYIDVLNNGGVFSLVYTEVSNNAASPALATNSLRLAIVVTGASTIADVDKINNGSYMLNTPAATGIQFGCGAFDSLANPIRPTDPDRKVVGAGTRGGTTTTGAPGGSPAGGVAWNGMNSIPFIAKPKTNYRLEISESIFSGYSSAGRLIFILHLGTTALAYTSQVTEKTFYIGSGGHGLSESIEFNSGTYSGLTWLNIKMDSTGWSGVMSMNATSGTFNGRPAIYRIVEI